MSNFATEMSQKNLDIRDFDYNLPDERIAKHPLAEREKCKLLYRRPGGDIEEHIFAELPGLLPDDAMLIYNNTRVINARMRFAKDTGAAIEIFCLEPHTPGDYAENFASTSSCAWTCLVGNSKRWKDGALTLRTSVDGHPLTVTATRLSRDGASSVIRFDWDRPDCTFASVITAAGVIPIPPYLNRDTEASDSADYQTVYARMRGSVAAPTAGLHFTDSVLNGITRRGIPRRELTLHVGAGTFQPVKDDDVSRHVMHSECIAVPLSLIEELAETPRRVYAVGTTTVRTLESLYHIGCMMHQGIYNGEVEQWYPYSPSHPHLDTGDALRVIVSRLKEQGQNTLVASTRIIISPGYRYRIVKGLITNFHQPRSTLLLLVSAMIGDDWRRVYRYALDHDFRFLSYGDACLFEI